MGNGNESSDRQFLRRLTIAAAAVAGLWLAWTLSDLLLLIFAALLFAVILRGVADAVVRWLRLPERFQSLSVAAAVLLLLGVLAGAAWLFGAQIRAQASELSEQIPDAWEQLQDKVGDTAAGERIRSAVEEASPPASGIVSRIGQLAFGFAGAVTDFVLVVVGGIYLAAQPGIYRTGLLQLVPDAARQRTDELLRRQAQALRKWLFAQLLSMIAVGLITGVGLWLIGVPSALALGLLAGLAEFVPILGPILAAIPALLIALTMGFDTILWVAGLYLLIQQIEGNLLSPLVMQHAVSLPPAVALFSIVAFGLLFGLAGILLAAPLSVAALVIVREVYLKDTDSTGPS